MLILLKEIRILNDLLGATVYLIIRHELYNSHMYNILHDTSSPTHLKLQGKYKFLSYTRQVDSLQQHNILLEIKCKKKKNNKI